MYNSTGNTLTPASWSYVLVEEVEIEQINPQHLSINLVNTTKENRGYESRE